MEARDLTDNAFSEASHVEIDQETETVVPELQLREQLCLVNRDDLCDRLGFDHNTVVDQKINSIGDIELDPIIPHRDGDFAADREAALAQFVCETHLICPFEQSRSKH